MAVSPKVSAATVGASFTTIVTGILGPHLFPHGMAPDVQGLVTAVFTAVVTFAAGWFAREASHDAPQVTNVVRAVQAEVAKADTVFTQVKQAVVAEPKV